MPTRYVINAYDLGEPVTRDIPRDCSTCRFWLNAPDLSESGGLGKCRRRAPVATGGMMSAPETIWPITGEAEWCGEYEEA